MRSTIIAFVLILDDDDHKPNTQAGIEMKRATVSPMYRSMSHQTTGARAAMASLAR
jgi:hypothetical protein